MSIPTEFRIGMAAAVAALAVSQPALAGGSCPADLDGDGVVGIRDLLELLQALGPCRGCPEDINGDGVVGGPDLAILVGSWGACPTPKPGREERYLETVSVDVSTPEATALGLTVTHVFATGPEVAVGDALLIADEALITTDGATLYQHILGDDLPPIAEILRFFPELAFDTFVTMNRTTADFDLIELPWVDMDHDSVEGGWFAIPGPLREAEDISAITGNPDQAGVLIAQITLRCAGDVNLDGTVSTADLLDLLAAWGGGGPADFTNDNTVTTADLLILLSGWGECAPGYSGTVRLYTDGGTLEGVVVPVFFQR